MERGLSKKEKLARLAKQMFTGRVNEKVLFNSLLPLNRQSDADILMIYGIGGIGKSALLGEFRRICQNSGIPVALVDGQAQKSVYSILLEIATQISESVHFTNNHQLDLPKFYDGLKRYRSIQEKLVRQSNMPQKLAKVIVQAAKIVPVVGTVAEVVGEDNIQRAMDVIYSTVGRADGDFYLQPEEELTSSLVEDINAYARDKRIVIMFDTYEVMTALDGWVRDSLFVNLNDYALLVIAGRHKLEGKAWNEFAPLMIQHELTGLSSTEAQDYLSKRNVLTDDLGPSALISFADGHPLTLSLLAELGPNNTLGDLGQVSDLRNVIKELIERIVGKIDDDLRSALEVCSVLRFTNEESLAYMLECDEEHAARLFNALQNLDFVKVLNIGLSLHEAVRVALDEDSRWRAPKSYLKLHSRASDYYEKLLSKTGTEDKELYTIEHLYHSIKSNETEGIKVFQKLAEEYAGYRLKNHLQALLNEANQYSLEKENSRLWLEYYHARTLQLDMRLSDAEAIYQRISENEEAEPKLRAYSLCNWGEILSRYERLAQPNGIHKANSILEKSIQLVPLDFHLAYSFVYMARVQEYLLGSDELSSLYAKAKEFFEQFEDKSGLVYVLIEMKKELGSRGLWRDLFDIQNELESKLQQLPEIPALKCTALWRWTWGEALAGRLVDSERKLSESITISRSLNDSFSLLSALRDLAWTLGHQGQYEEASELFTESLEIVDSLGKDYEQDYATGIGFWGAVLTRQGDFDRALEYLTRALSIKEKIGDHRGALEQLAWLGRLYETQGDFENAQSYYTRGLDLKFCRRLYFDVYIQVGLIRTDCAIEEYSKLPALIEEAEKIAIQYEYYDHLASLNLIQGHLVWDGHPIIDSDNVEPGFPGALNFYKRTLIFAMRYNRFLLDEVLWGGTDVTPLHPIIAKCKQKEQDGQTMLKSLRDWWLTGVNLVSEVQSNTISPVPENITLLEAETFVRKREVGNGKPQRKVLDRLDETLNADNSIS